MIRLNRYSNSGSLAIKLVAVLFVLLSNAAIAAQCTDIFTNGVSSHSANGWIEFKNSSKIIDPTSTSIDFPAISKNHNVSCTSQSCVSTGNNTAKLALPSFKTSSGDDKTPSNNSSLSNGLYGDVKIKNGRTVTFDNDGSDFRMASLTLESSAKLYLDPGDYWVGSLIMKNNDTAEVFTNGSGTVRLFVQSATFGQSSKFNLDKDNPEKFFLVSYGDLELKNSVEIGGYVYAVGHVDLKNSAKIFGGLNAATVDMRNSSEIHTDLSGLSNLDTDDLCADAQSPISVANYGFEQNSWSGNGSVTDTTGNFNGSPIGSVNPVLPTNQKSCRALEVPNNTSSTTYYAVDTGITPNDNIGIRGTISFWYKSNQDWETGNDRQLFDASTTANDRYFFLTLKSNGQLELSMEDENDKRFRGTSTAQTFDVDEWVHIAVTWDLIYQTMSMFINGSAVTVTMNNESLSTDLADFNTLYIGDNRSTYFSGSSTPNSADGMYDDVRIYNFEQSVAQVIADRDDVSECVTEVDHYEISFNPSGSICADSTITLNACANADCSTLVTDTVTADLQYTDDVPVTTTIQSGINIVNGTATLDWGLTTPQTVTLSLTNESPAPDNSNECSPSDCNITFSGISYVIKVNDVATDIENQIGEQNFPKTITLETNQVCTAAIGADPVEARVICDEPTSCSNNAANNYELNGIELNKGARVSASDPDFIVVENNFDEVNGFDISDMVYNDAGQVTLELKIGSITTSSQFVVSPAAFQVATSGAVSTVIAGSSVPGYEVVVTARGINNGVMRSYQESDFQISMDRAVPSQIPTGVDFNGDLSSLTAATLSLDDGLIPTSDGNANNERSLTDFVSFGGTVPFVDGVTELSLRYDEVGEIDIDVRDQNYLNAGSINSSLSSGIRLPRYIPSHFIAGASFAYNTHCSDTIIQHYLGQTFTSVSGVNIQLSPRNAQDELILYYDSGTSQSFNFPTTGLFPNRSYDNDNATGPTVSTTFGAVAIDSAETSNFDGYFDFDVTGETFLVNKGSTPIAPQTTPYDAGDANSYDIHLNIPAADVLDSDGIGYKTNAADSSFLDLPVGPLTSGIELREGRLNLANAYGPETENLVIPFEIEYFDGANWVTNVQDSCVTYNASNLAVTSGQSLSTISMSDETTVNGIYDLDHPMTFQASGVIAESEVEYQLPTDLQFLQFDWDGVAGVENPSATVSFGQYRGNDRVIHWREVFR